MSESSRIIAPTTAELLGRITLPQVEAIAGCLGVSPSSLALSLLEGAAS